MKNVDKKPYKLVFNTKELKEEGDGYFKKNIEELLKINNIAQSSIVKDTGLSKQTVSNYCIGNHPSVEFLLYLKKKFNLSMDDLVTRVMSTNELDLKLEKNEGEKKQESTEFTDRIREYQGCYVTYEIDDRHYKGAVPSEEDNVLQYGVLIVYRPPGVTTERECRSLYLAGLKDKEECRTLLEKAGEYYNEKKYVDVETLLHHANEKKFMSGTFRVEENEGYISLSRRNAQALMIFRTVPPEISQYIGGVATFNTISGGGDAAPTLKLVGISRTMLVRSDREIYRHLLFTPDFRARERADEFLQLVDKYYNKNDDLITKGLSEEQKKIIIQANIELAVKKEVEANNFRFFKLAGLDDNRFYQFLKENQEKDKYAGKQR